LPEDLPQDVLQSCAHVHLTAWSLFTEPPRAAALRAAQIAKAGGATVSFDPASYQMIRELGYDKFARITADLPVDMLFPNRDEGQALTGEREPAAIAQALRARYPGAIVALKLDREGCFVMADGHAQAYPTSDHPALDATGGGDAFDAAFIARYARDPWPNEHPSSGQRLAAAARFANTIAGWVVARYGARPPGDEELADMLRGSESAKNRG
jgi:ribokinase